ncbi:hypothetical protein C4K35_6522 [Pseudomonas chlororaphis subsp. piscium]|nr:hypothetical protein C4K35_6522 [Pseudomonas chlororaphis subsp. piscium]AZC60389.1 hypothetical protein C4K34_6269 [Pseudomonas chlororaphis subsp. piscium]AZC66539.1 hypothetical protein C4K33_6092 [Pseudomonas chlororaphis subsp. piscium]AZC72800.1 hypothetical protein C4K32_6183 [Pseudomonas chlororaphis subsp. piscium]AZC79010.1 hypothetical protein C4K31_6152 [Pseudomonas chlororaphis subsp. piscium]
MAFFEITVYYARETFFACLTVSKSVLIQLSAALSRARIVISMMATSKHPLKQQDELSSASRKRLPYI